MEDAGTTGIHGLYVRGVGRGGIRFDARATVRNVLPTLLGRGRGQSSVDKSETPDLFNRFHLAKGPSVSWADQCVDQPEDDNDERIGLDSLEVERWYNEDDSSGESSVC